MPGVSIAWKTGHRKGAPHDDQEGGADAMKKEAEEEDLLGCTTGLPVPLL